MSPLESQNSQTRISFQDQGMKYKDCNPLIDQRTGLLHAWSLDIFQDSYLGSIHEIWAKLPVELIERGFRKRVAKDHNAMQRLHHCRGRARNNGSNPKRIKVVVDAKDGFEIDGFGKSRKCELISTIVTI